MLTEFVMPLISDLPSGPMAVKADMPGTSEFVADQEKIPSNAGMAHTRDTQARHEIARNSFSTLTDMAEVQYTSLNGMEPRI